MAKMILRDAFVSINAVDLSLHVKEVEVSWDVSIEDVTTMGASGKQKLAGIEDDNFSITWLQDYAAAKVDATIAPLIRAAAFAFEIRPTTAAVSATNPKFTGNALLASYQPVAGSVGSAHEVSSDFEVDGVITRATA
jgi:hypothetical protein